MRLSNALAAFALLGATITAIAIPETSDLIPAHQPTEERDDSTASPFFDLWKRRGGGGSGGRGGGSSSSGSSGSSSSGGSSSSSGSGSSSGSSGSSSGSSSSSSSGKSGSSSSSSNKGSSGSSSSSGRGSSSSSTGGRTSSGSGVSPSYGGGKYYGGGATVPYRSGSRSTSGIVPVLFAGAAVAAFWPGIWHHSAYLYPYGNHWTYHNATTGRNETKPVECGCDASQECGCDDNANQTYVDSVMGNGSYEALNKSLVTLGKVNGTETILLNGTLANGTTASGGTESASAAAAGLQELAQMAGWWPLVATAAAMVVFA